MESVRPLLTKQEIEYLTPIFTEVYEAIRSQNPNMGEIRLYIQDVMTVNACAIGKHTVAVTKGAIETFSQAELKGVLAHEMGHIAHGDTMAVIINTVGNGIFSVIVCIMKIYIFVIDLIISAFQEIAILRVIFIFVKFIFEMTVMLFLFMGQALLSVNSRQNEFEADEYAYENGYGRELVRALYLLQKMSLSEKMSMKKRLVATHPIFAWRINKIETMIDNE
jgi:heat shock protein HtpX